MELLIEDNLIMTGGLSFPLGSGVTSFIRLGLDEINHLYNEIIISCISAGKNDAGFSLWADKKLSGIEKNCFYMIYYNDILKKIVFDYAENGALAEPHDYYLIIPELKRQSLLNYINQEIDDVSRNKVLINFISQRAFDNMTEKEKDENCKALMRFLYFRDAILYNISAFQKLCSKKISAVFGENADGGAYIFSARTWFAFDDRLGKFTETIKIEKAEQLADIEIMKLANSGLAVKECQGCGRYFVPSNRTDAIYCSHTDKQTGKSCAQTGALKKFRKKLDDIPAHKEYSKAYKRGYARVRAGKLDGESHKKWSGEARALRDKCLEGKISIEEFTAFLYKPFEK